MRIEVPEFKRCCCCLPLRRGLLFWVYLKLAVGLFLIYFFINGLLRMLRFGRIGPSIIVSVLTIVMVIDVAFCILFIISAHRKKHEHMRIYYRYGVGSLIFEVIVMLGMIAVMTYIAITSMPYTIFFIQDFVEFTCNMFLELVLHAYLIVLVRSEVLKLERGAKFEFLNHTSEPECKAQNITI